MGDETERIKIRQGVLQYTVYAVLQFQEILKICNMSMRNRTANDLKLCLAQDLSPKVSSSPRA